MRSALRRYGLIAFRDGLLDGGLDPESLGETELKVFREWQAEQSGYVSALGAEVFQQGITEAEVRTRATMWANMSLDRIHSRAKTLAAPKQKARFRLGATKDHCLDCSYLDGKIATLEDWQKSGWEPRSGISNRHACGGFHCDCGLDDTDDAVNFDPYKYVTRGRKSEDVRSPRIASNAFASKLQ
jgi:hypothetical protein